MTKTRNIIPLFFAIDENYAPYLSVTLNSIKTHASDDNFYKVHVMHHKLRDEDKEKLNKYVSDNFSITYLDVQKELEKFGDAFPLRDYFTNTTYYRFFIESMCPEFDKGLYLDSDLVLFEDVANLYNHDIENYLVGAVTEDVMNNFDVFGTFVEKTLGIERKKYFNAGVLLINLKKFREQKILNKFYDMLNKYSFPLTQDQDYLNVLCKDQVLYIDSTWNRAPIPGTELSERELSLVHYKISWKPWKYYDVMYGEKFWDYAKNTDYFHFLFKKVNGYTEENKQKDNKMFDGLVELAIREANDENNYYNTINKSELA